MKLKIALLAPIPSARVRTATRLKAGRLRRVRKPKRTSLRRSPIRETSRRFDEDILTLFQHPVNLLRKSAAPRPRQVLQALMVPGGCQPPLPEVARIASAALVLIAGRKLTKTLPVGSLPVEDKAL